MKFMSVITVMLIFCKLACSTELVDDFSQKDWQKLKNSSGKMIQQQNKLYLESSKDNKLTWERADKTFDIDIDQTPLLVIGVSKLTDDGQVKVIKQNPYDKKPVLSISAPGIFTVNLKDVCRWQGKQRITVSLYSIGKQSNITYSFIKFTDKLSKSDLAEQARIKASLNKRPSFEVVPLFNSCSYYYTSPKLQDVNVAFRKAAGQWQKALPPVWVSEDKMYRGSIVNLDENTTYEFKICAGNKCLKSTFFKTWSSEVPIAQTITLDESNFKGHLDIRDKGTPQGWIKYTSAPGFVLKNDGKKPLLELNKAEYVIIEGLTLQGGSDSAIFVRKCKNARFINCDISGWGLLGKQRFDIDGKFFLPNGRAINNNSGIYLIKSKNTVVERCYFHDPRNAANSWRYSHPAGPEGMMIAYPESTVIRYNDFIGSDKHRWNDAIEGAGNFKKNGGFNRDADIYGNFMAFGNDDGIEIDGGQQNVRVFLNKFEGFLCGVSIQGCMAGPSYVFRNLIVNMGDEFGTAGQMIKTSSNVSGKDAVSFIFNNTLSSAKGTSLPLHRLFKIVAKNNILAGHWGVGGRQTCKKAETDYNLVVNGKPGDESNGIFGKKPQFEDKKAALFKPLASCPSVGTGVTIDNFATGESIDIGAIPQNNNLILPYRPIPLKLDKYQLNFDVKTSAIPTQTVTATVDTTNYSTSYTIRKNKAFDWFSVTPESGQLTSGTQTEFTVKLIPEKMQSQTNYKGVFLVRLADGYSRPITVYAVTNVKQAIKPCMTPNTTIYIEAENPTGGKPYINSDDTMASGGKCAYIAHPDPEKPRTTPAEYSFEVPEDGLYFIMMRIKSETPVGCHDSLKYAIDNEEMKAAHMRSDTSWIWTNSANNDIRLMHLKAHKLSKGKHAIKILPRESVYLDLIAVTKNPKTFEHR